MQAKAARQPSVMRRFAQTGLPCLTQDVNLSELTFWTALTTVAVATVSSGDGPAPEFMPPTTRSGHLPQGCIACHEPARKGFTDAHRFGEILCTPCHDGRPDAGTKEDAHSGLIAFPGNLSNADRTCGRCHADHVKAVQVSPMATGAGIVASTRELFTEPPGTGQTATLSGLGFSPADVLLRKLCASCHLHQDKSSHSLDPTTDRGGGCLACHINDYPKGAHPALSVRVSDARCFGCHSRSSRISLNYAGIAEVEPPASQRPDPSTLGRLDDGRLVEFLPPDIHHRAGMSCIDCHTSRGVMGMERPERGADPGPDILCIDCHENRSARLELDTWPEKLEGQIKRIPFALLQDQKFLTTKRRGTPLWHIEIRATEKWLHRKQDPGRLPIPPLTRPSHPYTAEHGRLSCSACHSAWAPQCYGCHTTYDSNGNQWDHLAKKTTAGKWTEERWNVFNGPPPLGVTPNNRIVPVVPGMIMTLAHPGLETTIFRRRFAPIAPHTTGSARSCDSCHRSSLALGLGRGRLQKTDGRWTFIPALTRLGDGLPADAWTSLKGRLETGSPSDGARPFNTDELYRILDAIPEPNPNSHEPVH